MNTAVRPAAEDFVAALSEENLVSFSRAKVSMPQIIARAPEVHTAGPILLQEEPAISQLKVS